jgi:peptidyl-prolyl cis-trans isomerase D
MMTKLREFSKLFIIIVAASFIGLMVFEWGANYSGKRSQAQNIVGSVNGHELTYSMFSELYQQLYENYRARTGESNMDDNTLKMLRDQVWEQFIQRTLFEEQMKKLGITVSDSEIVYQIYNYPLDDFKQHPAFQTNGVFDMQKYRQALGNPNIPWLQVEEIYRQQIPFVKLQNIISNTVRVSDQEVLDEYKKDNLKVNVEYLGINASSFSIPDEAVTEDEIEQFYNEHKEDYKQNEKRQLSYVLFPVKTTKEDTNRVFADFKEIKKRLENGDDFNELALIYSMDPSAQQNKGELGYFAKGDMAKPFSDAAFSAKVGEIVGPVQTSFGWHLIKVEDKKVEDGKEKVKASHILIKVTPSRSTEEEQESKANYFSDDAKESGFNVIAQRDSLEVMRTSLFEEQTDFIPGIIGRNPAIVNFAFASKLNEVSGVYRLDAGYVVLTVSQIQKAGYQDIESVRRLLESRVRSEKAKERAREYAVTLKPKVDSDTPFKTIASQDTAKKVQYNVTGMITMDSNIRGLGKSVEFTATAFSLEPGQRSDMVDTDRGYYYLHLLEKTSFDSSAFNAQKEAISRRLLSQKKNQIFSEWYASLKERADIKDNRTYFNL